MNGFEPGASLICDGDVALNQKHLYVYVCMCALMCVCVCLYEPKHFNEKGINVENKII